MTERQDQVAEPTPSAVAPSGLIRVIYCNSENIEEAIRFVKGERETNEEEEYDDNIQTADINCLAASVAVGIWKQKIGIYHTEEKICNWTFRIERGRCIAE